MGPARTGRWYQRPLCKAAVIGQRAASGAKRGGRLALDAVKGSPAGEHEVPLLTGLRARSFGALR
ncbi:hypothetical protein Acsp03_50820 [Actinomadura sp. NBRC 104412]|nr:hypothetical protein Acsp03_50820 [Actinomadura sp. NBRC 104412]